MTDPPATLLVLVASDRLLAFVYRSAEDLAADRHAVCVELPCGPPLYAPPRKRDRLPLPHARLDRTRIYEHEDYLWRECRVTPAELARWLERAGQRGARLTECDETLALLGRHGCYASVAAKIAAAALHAER